MVSAFTALLERTGAEGATSADRKAVAQRLVRLAQESDSAVLVDACIEEVERLSALGPEAPAYGVDPEALPPLA